mgnify:CR=1 FL=1
MITAVALSHWVLDVISHRPDLPLTLTGGLRYTKDDKDFNVEAYEFNTVAACFDPHLASISAGHSLAI